MDSFCHLHVHSEFSLLDGAAKLGPLCAEAARLGMPAVALTDHGNMHGAFEFYQQARANGITPVLGMEAYVAPDSRHDRAPVYWGHPGQRRDDVSGQGAYTHMTLLAENPTGLRNLFTLSSLASLQGHYRKSRIDRELLAQHAEGIIGTTGCPSGEVQTRLRLGQRAEALQAASDYRDILGTENFFLELMDHGLPIERSVREGLLEIGRALDLKPLATNDSHYVTQDQAEAHAALLCVQTGKTLDDPTRFKFDGDGYYLKTAAEMRALWDEQVPGACDNTLAIAERVTDYAEVFAPADRLPPFPVPPGHTQASWLRAEVTAGLHRRYPAGASPGHQRRAEDELTLIISAGFAAYFLVVADLVAWARAQGIRVGVARGSVGGSLVAYALGITGLDPIRHSLLFERFLNPERVMMPDIDLDFDDRRRGEVISYLVGRYGSDRVAQIATFGTIKARAAIRDAARVTGRSFAVGDRMCRAMPPTVMGHDIPLFAITDTDHPRHRETGPLRELLGTDAEAATVMATARGLEGLARQVGVHASAIAISAAPLVEVLPVWQREEQGLLVTAWDKDACDAIGLLKIDCLGLRNLTVISDTLHSIERSGAAAPDLESLTLDDPAVFRLLARGETLGVFQLDGGSMRDLLRRIAPTCFGDISAALALYRPGPMGANAHLEYADRKNGRAAIVPIHDELAEPLADILDETYGLIVYQEQVMAIAQRVAGYSLGRADLLRKAMGKKKKDVLDKEYEPFAQGMREHDYSIDAITTLWNILVPFSDYAFGRAHTAAYAIIAYQTAYLKVHYPREYMAALLSSVGDKKERLALYLAECRRLGIAVLPPDVNSSDHQFTLADGGIRFGLAAVRDVGGPVVDGIVAGRSPDAYKSFADFVRRVPASGQNKQAIEALIKAGAFDSLDHPRQGLHLIHGEVLAAAQSARRTRAPGQGGLFDAEEESGSFDVPVPEQEWDRQELLLLERDVLGLYVSGHPVEGAQRVLARSTLTPLAEILDGEVAHDLWVRVGGILSRVAHKVTRRGEPWATAQLEDLTATVELLFFPKTYATMKAAIQPDTIVLLAARVSMRDDRISLVVRDLSVPDLTTPLVDAPVTVLLDVGDCTVERVARLREVLAGHPGPQETRVLLQGDRQHLLALQPRVALSDALVGELESVLRPGCVVRD